MPPAARSPRCNNGIDLHAEGEASGSLGGDQGGARAEEEIEHDVTRHAAVVEGAFDERKWFHRRMCLRLRRPRYLPDVALVTIAAPVVLAAVAPSEPERLVLPLVVGAAHHESILSPDDRVRPVGARLGENPAHRRPFLRRHADVERAVHRRKKGSNPRSAKGFPIFGCHRVIGDAALTLAALLPTVIAECGVVGRVAKRHCWSRLAQKLGHVDGVGGVSAHDPMPIDDPQLATLGSGGRTRRCDRTLHIERLRAVALLPSIQRSDQRSDLVAFETEEGQVGLGREIREEAGEELFIPRAADPVQRDVQEPRLVIPHCDEDNRHRLNPQSYRSAEAQMPSDDLAPATGGDDRIDETELCDASRQGFLFGGGISARVPGIRVQGVDGDVFDPQPFTWRTRHSVLRRCELIFG